MYTKIPANEGKDPIISKKILRVDQIYSRKDRQIHYVKTAKSPRNNERFNRYALVVRRIINELGLETDIQVDVRSSKLAKVIQEVLKGTQFPGLNKDPPYSHPRILFHIAPILKERSAIEETKKEPDVELITDTNELLDFVKEEFRDVSGSIASLQQHVEITYDLLWSIFPPKCQVVQQTQIPNEHQMLKFSHGVYVVSETQGMFFQVTAHLLNHDGANFGWGQKIITIDFFSGTKPITSLNLFPAKFDAEKEKMKKNFSDRGQRFLDLLEPVCKEYEGMGLESEFEYDKWIERQFHVTGRVMIDPVAFRKKLPDSILLTPRVTKVVAPKDVPKEDLVFCNHRALGFSFEQKRWAAVSVSGLCKVTWDQDAIQSLILGEKRERLITSLVLSHTCTDGGFDDVIKGKGQGLVGLLSGPPGVGKTLTAEVVAELSQRPLYVVTAGELGTSATDLDTALAGILSLVRRWGCVLLFDEADIFLRKRGEGQIEQNALVSIFLRRLEYFHGIIILTTNRAQDIDEAFKSRIHFKFEYPPLDEKGRLAIWRGFLSKIPNKDESTITETSLSKLARIPLNGREIKNTVSCAQAVVNYTKERLSLEVIESILETLTGSWEDEKIEDLI